MLLVTLVILAALNCTLGQGGWWKNAVYYRIMVDSFKDGDGDGLGDLIGVTKQISYIRAIGADAVIISPISSRSKDCSAPGVMDHTAIDNRYGDMDVFNEFLQKAKRIELKVVITLPLSTISTASEWFRSSVDGVPEYEDHVVWRHGNYDTSSEDKNVSWTWNERRNAYWGGASNEALLNLCLSSVVAILSSAQCAWLRRGIDGVLINPDYLLDQKCGEDLLKKLAADSLSCRRGAGLDMPVILVETSLNPLEAARYYGNRGPGASSIVSGAMTDVSQLSTTKVGIDVQSALLTAVTDSVPTWMTSTSNGNHITSRIGTDLVDAVNLLALMLPGATLIHQGDELGVADTILEWATSTNCWPNQASPSLTPFPWDESISAGFTTGDPWLPLPPNYRYANAKMEFSNEFSHAGVLKVAAALRKSPAMGPHSEIKRLNGALAVLRWGGQGTLLVISNLDRDQTEVQPSMIPGLPTEMTVAINSAGSRLSTGAHVALEKSVSLAPGETILLIGGPRHCGGPGPVDKITNKLTEGWQKINKYFSNL
ncbi:maltase A3 [Bombyx mori]|uniref:Glycosyl hydrolase family 13 catalytic domain-containing protein n=1 Tax=Bombyx mori TaxID=7091 RepID=A0A8R2HNW2_BOMMO|nr:maltase A3 [Bombyx mori]